MLKMVSVAAAGILLAAPASAAVMQVVFTGEETWRSWENRGMRYDDSSYDFYESGTSADYAGTSLTWTFRYDTDLGTFEESENNSQPDITVKSQKLYYAITHSELAHGGDVFVHDADPLDTSSIISSTRQTETDTNNGEDLQLEQYDTQFSKNKTAESYPGDTTFDYFNINLTSTKWSHFTPWDFSAPFSVLFSSDDYAVSYVLWDRGENFYTADGNFNGDDRFQTSVAFNITSLTVTSWDDGTIDPPVSPVPLPATAPLLLAALGGAWALRRRRHA